MSRAGNDHYPIGSMSCEIKDRLKRGYEEANQRFGDCLIALTRIQAGRQYDLLTMQKDLFNHAEGSFLFADANGHPYA